MNETLRPVSIVDAVCDAIRERILTGQLGPAEVLYEQATAELYGVARPTAKAAIDRLVHAGLLRRTANKSAHVPQLTEADVHDLYFSRLAIETMVVSHLAAEGLVPDKAQAALRDFDAAAKAGSVQGIIDSDIAFHQALVESVGSPRVLRMYSSIIGEAHLCMVLKQTHHLQAPKAIAREHRAIYDAILGGNSEVAQTKLAQHLQKSERAIRSHIRDTDERRVHE
ncbi:MAG TPA: GntR family transcriptional regulator [Mycobacteriales bacterium]|jgi:DNA-binding GntR family transcriptional regulator|nr:GntR family transcriptional regulator [Mycobacteriales bacterium]